MKIILIRHGPTNMVWPKYTDAAGFDGCQRAYEKAQLLPIPAEKALRTDRTVYASPSPLAQRTAEAMLGGGRYVVSPLLVEIPLRSFADTRARLPLRVFRAAARVQWYANHPRQSEGRDASRRRARELLALLEKRGEDCVLISHGRFLRLLMSEAQGPEYELRGGQGGLAFLEKAAIVPKEPHCGSCGHNCPLSRPGCQIGREKAALQKQK